MHKRTIDLIHRMNCIVRWLLDKAIAMSPNINGGSADAIISCVLDFYSFCLISTTMPDRRDLSGRVVG